MTISANFRGTANSIFRKTAWLASATLIATLLVASPMGGTAARAEAASVAPTSISVGGSHACAVIDGGVKCWGNNQEGQLGVANLSATATAVDALAPNSGATQVSAGGFHTCAVVEGGVECWGLNNGGQLGGEPENSSHGPMPALDASGEPLSGVAQVSASTDHTCVVFLDGGLGCWGYNSGGRLGNAAAAEGESGFVYVVDSGDAPIAGVTQVSAGGSSTCAVFADRSVKCWGFNDAGQLGVVLQQPEGDGPSIDRSAVPQETIPASALATSVSVGENFACATIASGVQCWGLNAPGAGDQVVNETPTSIPQTGGALAVSAGDNFVCATFSFGVKCWGNNLFGQLGTGSTSNESAPTRALALNSAGPIDAGGKSACAVALTSLKCWGLNEFGQLGNEDDLVETSAQFSLALPANVEAMESGYLFNCALANEAVWCWGNNEYGQLGDGTFTSSNSPVVAISSGATAIALGDSHACAVVASKVLCWGNNESGQLGYETDLDSYGEDALPSPDPQEIASTPPGLVSQITAGDSHTCVLAEGEVLCWGRHAAGQLGIGGEYRTDLHLASGTVWRPVLGITETVDRITAGDGTTCAVSDQGLWCWGYKERLIGNLINEMYQLTPELLQAGPVGDVAVGDNHVCAVVGLEVRCWGNNQNAQLGSFSPDGTTGDESLLALTFQPTSIDGAFDPLGLGDHPVSKVGVGYNFSCALNGPAGNAAVWCWGKNDVGQLGIGEAGVNALATPARGLTSGVSVVSVGYNHACAAKAEVIGCWGPNDSGALGKARVESSSTPITATGVFAKASITLPSDSNSGSNSGSGQQTSTVDHTIFLKPELNKINRISVSKLGQRVTLSGANLNNVQSVLVGAKAAKIIWSSSSEMVLELPANLSGSPVVTLVSKSGIQTFDGLMQIVKPYLARSVKVSAFKGNALAKAAAVSVRKSYLRDSSVNLVTCTAVVGKGATAKTKAATIAKSVSACSAVSGYSVKFSEFKISVRTLKTATAKPFVMVTFDRSSPVLVN